MSNFEIVAFAESTAGALKAAIDTWLETDQPTSAIWDTWTAFEAGGTFYAMVICLK